MPRLDELSRGGESGEDDGRDDEGGDGDLFLLFLFWFWLIIWECGWDLKIARAVKIRFPV